MKFRDRPQPWTYSVATGICICLATLCCASDDDRPNHSDFRQSTHKPSLVFGNLFLRHGRSIVSTQFSPSESELLCADAAGDVWIWNLMNPEESHRLCANGSPAVGVAFSSDGKSIVLLGSNGHLSERDATTGEATGKAYRPPNGTGYAFRQATPTGFTISADSRVRAYSRRGSKCAKF